MPVTEQNRRKHDYAIQAITASNLSAALKEDLAEVVSDALETTNGLTAEEKLQASTENQFNLARLLALFIAGQGRHVATWKDVLMAYKWPLLIAFGFLCILLVLRPELAGLVDSLAHMARQ